MLFKDFGGFDGLYVKMLASNIPTTVQLMWIPLSELSVGQHFLLIMRFSQQCWNEFWNSKDVKFLRNFVYEIVTELNEDILMVVVCPVVELLIPYVVIILATFVLKL